MAEQYKVAGITFNTKEEYDQAKKEYDLVSQMLARYDIEDPDIARTILEKFRPKTQIGKAFTARLRKNLRESEEEEQKEELLRALDEAAGKTHSPRQVQKAKPLKGPNLTPKGNQRAGLIVGVCACFLLAIGSFPGALNGNSPLLLPLAFGLIGVGLLLQLNVGGIRAKIPLLNEGTSKGTGVFWVITVCAALAVIGGSPTLESQAGSSIQGRSRVVDDSSTYKSRVEAIMPTATPRPTPGPTAAPLYSERSYTKDVPKQEETKTYSVTVYVTSNGTKYHSNPNCSRMKNPKAISLTDAINYGYTACSKCY